MMLMSAMGRELALRFQPKRTLVREKWSSEADGQQATDCVEKVASRGRREILMLREPLKRRIDQVRRPSDSKAAAASNEITGADFFNDIGPKRTSRVPAGHSEAAIASAQPNHSILIGASIPSTLCTGQA